MLRVLALLGLAAVAGCAGVSSCLPQTPVGYRVAVTEFDLPVEPDRAAVVRVYAPENAGSYPLIVFSHGALAAPERYDELLFSWALGGYVVAAPLHIDSELLQHATPPAREEVWRSRQADVIALAARPDALRNQLAEGVTVAASPWVAAGHSYGAFVAQVIAGAASEWDDLARPAPPDALIALSPPGPLAGFIGPDAWIGLDVPQLLLTGTADVLPGFIDDWQAHAAAHEQAGGPDQWLWVGVDVDHYFGRLMGRLDRDSEPQTAQFQSARDAMARFLDNYADNGGCPLPIEPYANDVATLTRKR